MNNLDFFHDFLTHQLFYRLENFTDNIRFEWFRMIAPTDVRHGRRMHAECRASHTRISINELLCDVRNNEIPPNWFRLSEICIDNFIWDMNLNYNIIGIEVGIWRIITSVVTVSPQTNEPQVRIIYRIAPVQFGMERNSGNKRFIKKPKPFKLVA